MKKKIKQDKETIKERESIFDYTGEFSNVSLSLSIIIHVLHHKDAALVG